MTLVSTKEHRALLMTKLITNHKLFTMPYKSREELPEAVQSALRSVPHAQDIYKEAYNSAFESYADASSRREGRSREESAHAVAWNAVKQKYEKGADDLWHPKD